MKVVKLELYRNGLFGVAMCLRKTTGSGKVKQEWGFAYRLKKKKNIAFFPFHRVSIFYFFFLKGKKINKLFKIEKKKKKS
jgi:hypothetical protein